MRRRIARYRVEQVRLHRIYGLSDSVQPSCELPEAELPGRACNDSKGPRFAVTSGSTGSPKEVLYSRTRIRDSQRMFIAAFLRAYVAMRPKRRSFYVLSSLQADDSLTSLMMEEGGAFPPYVSGLQAPYRVQAHPVFRELQAEFGDTAVRVWVLAISNPGVIYCTNPSTLSTFIEAVECDWERCRSLLELELSQPNSLPAELRACRRRLESLGSQRRLQNLVQRGRAPQLVELVPGLELYSCWDGGYVGIFLEKIQRHLLGSSVQHLPMYSMSTEVVETLPFFNRGQLGFLPVAPGVRYEFVALSDEDEASALLEAWELEEGREYTMVVSDAHGLRRYQTEDVFVCRKACAAGELPDLRFRRRRGLAWSFTGEKLTGDQVQQALESLRGLTSLGENRDWMGLVPTTHRGLKAPGYVVMLVGAVDPGESRGGALLDELLGRLNSEFASKLASGRLSPTETRWLTLEDYVAWAGGERHRGSWEAQFKFLPLLPRVWEDRSS